MQTEKHAIRDVFAANLKAQRQKRGLSRKQVADILKVSVSSMAMWETGERETDFRTLIMIADLFEISIDELLGRKPEDKQDKKWIVENDKIVGHIVLY